MGLKVYWLRRRPYREGLQWQKWAAEQVARYNVLLLLEHDPVYTIGAGGGWELFHVTPQRLVQQGVEIWKVGRGGKVTYHGPGQLVGYPILDLRRHGRDVHRYLRSLEDTLIDLCRAYGLAAERWPGKTGIWVRGAKIAAIGIRVVRWITFHGFALNVRNSVQPFTRITPCGLPDPVTSLVQWVSREPLDLETVAQRYAVRFARTFSFSEWEWVDASAWPTPAVSLDIRPLVSVPGAWVSPL